MTDKMLTQNLANDPRAMMRSCRIRAATMREIAAAMRDPAAQRVLRSKAQEWDRLAADAEARMASSLEGVAGVPSQPRHSSL